MAEEAFDDQCSGANPRYPLISEIRQLLLDSCYGRPYVEAYGREPEVARAEPIQAGVARAEPAM